ncbi:hypothetical protein F4677DRAFT_457612 [Hypoxylon crocopeplum]|nr:hypothetical protein F4677DRAFT_457612 [Hypoxylon crocopeplum]
MDSLNLWDSHKDGSTGWKQAAKVNCIVLAVMSVMLVACLIAASVQVGGIQKALFFYDGDCDGGNVSKVNMVLHLFINVVSTLVVTSSNFFMQVLNSPSREEVNAAHFKGSWMGIGIPSVRNAFKVARFKTWCWFCLLISSIPMHLLFNSAIFQTDRKDSDFHLTIATEDFLNGAPYYAPGAGLVQAGFDFWSYVGLLTESRRMDELVPPPNDYTYGAFGAPNNLTEYADKSSDAVKNISIAASATASRWQRLETHDCKQEYIGCSGLKYYRSVVLVVDKPGGWIRDDMWHLKDNQTEFWAKYVPPDQPNHLQTGSILTSGLQPGTFNMSVQYCLVEPLDRVCHIAVSPALLLAVTLCVIFKTCTAIVVTVVLSRRNQAPLVTLGDAMESFIERLDPVTAGMSTIGQAEIRRAMRHDKALLLPGPRQWQPLRKRRLVVIPISVWATSYLLFALGIGVCGYFLNGILKSNSLFGSFFESDQNSFIDAPFTFFGGILLTNSPQLLLSFCYLAYNNLFTRLQMAREWSLFSQGYRPLRVTDPKGDQYTTYRLQLPYKYSVPLIMISIFLHWLLSNTIYLFISTGGYFGTDNFLFQAQVDTSLPPNTAIAVGYSGYSLLVMLVVSCVLVPIPVFFALKKLPSNMVNIGSNSLALSAACHVSRLSHAVKPRAESLMPNSPASSRLDFPLSPSSPQYSRVLLAASRLSPASSKRQLLDRGSEDSGSDSSDGREEEQQQRSGPFTKLARSKIRWGVVEMPPEWHSEYDNEDGVVEHLSFGVEDDEVESPEQGRCYA